VFRRRAKADSDYDMDDFARDFFGPVERKWSDNLAWLDEAMTYTTECIEVRGVGSALGKSEMEQVLLGMAEFIRLGEMMLTMYDPAGARELIGGVRDFSEGFAQDDVDRMNAGWSVMVDVMARIRPDSTHSPLAIVQHTAPGAFEMVAVYEALRKPSLRLMRLPHLELMNRDEDSDIIVAAAKSATEAMAATLNAPGPLSPQLDRLKHCFADLLGRTHGGAIVAGATIGFIIGGMENESGVEREGMSEQHYECVLPCVMVFLPDDVTDSVYFGFIEECGYYLARMRGTGLEDLCATVRSEVEWMESHGGQSS
jgi:hypothetical protein